MTAQELEAMLIREYGPDFRNKAIATPLGSFRLADAFAECGLTDPQQSPSGAYGLWQMMPHHSGEAR
jgi:hypothetical protein